MAVLYKTAQFKHQQLDVMPPAGQHGMEAMAMNKDETKDTTNNMVVLLPCLQFSQLCRGRPSASAALELSNSREQGVARCRMSRS